MTFCLQGRRATNYATRPNKLVPSRIELLILALLAPRLNQLGQGTVSCFRYSLAFLGCSRLHHVIIDYPNYILFFIWVLLVTHTFPFNYYTII